jgi:uncharacterized protein (TIGR03000 family)
MRSQTLSFLGVGALVGAAFVAATSSGWAAGPGGSRLIHQGYYNNYFNYLQNPGYSIPRASQPRYFFYPSRGGYPRYNYRPYYDWHFLWHMTESPKEEQPKTPKDTHAHIIVRAPAGAELWFNGTKVTGEGEVRKFASPALTLGQRYSYEVRAQWTQNGQTITKTHELTVKAGAHIDVYFTSMDESKK